MQKKLKPNIITENVNEISGIDPKSDENSFNEDYKLRKDKEIVFGMLETQKMLAVPRQQHQIQTFFKDGSNVKIDSV